VGNGGVCQGCSSGRTEYFLKSNFHIAACSDFKADEAINDKIMSNKDEKQTWRITNAR